jgi:hypothetical protein
MANAITKYFEDKKAARIKAAKKAARINTIKDIATTIVSAALTIAMPVATSLILEAVTETTTSEKPEETKKKTTDETKTKDETPIEVKEIKNLYKAAKAVVTDDKKFAELEFIEYDIAGNLLKLKKIVHETIKQDAYIDGAVIVAGRITEAYDAVHYVHDYATAAAIAKHFDEKF